MTRCEDGGPAFPVIGAPGAPEDYPGMSLRDYFAAKALAAMLANPNKEGCNCGAGGLRTFPGYAYEWADAMLKARES